MPDPSDGHLDNYGGGRKRWSEPYSTILSRHLNSGKRSLIFSQISITISDPILFFFLFLYRACKRRGWNVLHVQERETITGVGGAASYGNHTPPMTYAVGGSRGMSYGSPLVALAVPLVWIGTRWSSWGAHNKTRSALIINLVKFDPGWVGVGFGSGLAWFWSLIVRAKLNHWA